MISLANQKPSEQRFPRISTHGNFVQPLATQLMKAAYRARRDRNGQMGETMHAFEPPKLISIVIRVYPTGPLYVRYQLLSGKIPQQSPAVFAGREQLAIQLRTLGLLDEAALVTLWDDEADFKFQVVSTRELMESFGFNHPPENIH
jgi:hypothetical protein